MLVWGGLLLLNLWDFHLYMDCPSSLPPKTTSHTVGVPFIQKGWPIVYVRQCKGINFIADPSASSIEFSWSLVALNFAISLVIGSVVAVIWEALIHRNKLRGDRS
jgi:hypothetical protein